MIVSYLVSKVPLSNHIPIVRRFHPKNQQYHHHHHDHESSVATSGSSVCHEEKINTSGAVETQPHNTDTDTDTDTTYINNTNNKRKYKQTDRLIIDDEDIFDAPNTKQTHLSFVDNSSTMKVSQRLARRNLRKVKESPKRSNSSKTLVDSSNNLTDESEYDRQDRVREYLDDQNNKFDGLITNNIDAVLHPELTKSPNERIIKMVYDNRKSIAGSIYQLGKAKVSSRLPYIPYFNPKHNKDNNNDKEDVGSSSIILGSPFTDYCQQVVEFDGNNEPYIEEPDSDVCDEEIFDPLMSDLNSEDEVDLFIDSLDDKTKIMLYEQLKNDLGDHSSKTGTFKEVYYNKNISALDKLQMFLIIWVKVWIASIKLFIPVTRYLIYKFQNNHLFLFNLKNIERLFDLILRFMNYLDTFMNHHEDTIDKMSNQDYVQAEQVYLDFTSYTSGLFNQTSFKEILFSPDVTKNKIYDLVLNTR